MQRLFVPGTAPQQPKWLSSEGSTYSQGRNLRNRKHVVISDNESTHLTTPSFLHRKSQPPLSHLRSPEENRTVVQIQLLLTHPRNPKKSAAPSAGPPRHRLANELANSTSSRNQHLLSLKPRNAGVNQHPCGGRAGVSGNPSSSPKHDKMQVHAISQRDVMVSRKKRS